MLLFLISIQMLSYVSFLNFEDFSNPICIYSDLFTKLFCHFFIKFDFFSLVLIWSITLLITLSNILSQSIVQQRRESSLKFQTRCIRTFPNKQGIGLIYSFVIMHKNKKQNKKITSHKKQKASKSYRVHKDFMLFPLTSYFFFLIEQENFMITG